MLIFSFMLTFVLIFSQFLLLDFIRLSVDLKYIIYSISQFLIGLLVSCLYCTAYVLLMEFTTEKYKTKIANLNSYIYVVGELIVFLIYYVSRNWHVLNWFIGLYSLVILILTYYFLPESPAWLIAMSHHNKAIKTLKKIAKTNGIKNYILPNSLIAEVKEQENLLLLNGTKTFDSDSHSTDNNNKKNIDINDNQINDNDEEYIDDKNCLLDIFMLKYLFFPLSNLIKTLVLYYIWSSMILLYYGVSLGVTNVELVIILKLKF